MLESDLDHYSWVQSYTVLGLSLKFAHILCVLYAYVVHAYTDDLEE